MTPRVGRRASVRAGWACTFALLATAPAVRADVPRLVSLALRAVSTVAAPLRPTQDADAPTGAERTEAEGATPQEGARPGSPGARRAAGEDRREPPLGPDGLPDPLFWTFDEDGHARDWLDKPPIDPADLRARPEAWAPVLEDHGIHLDPENRELLVRGATIHDARSLRYPIEYLVVTELGRTYEALVLVRSQPSVLAACLRALGAEPGGPTRTELKDPLPPEEDLEAGRASPWYVYPPHGPLVQIRMEWTDDAGRRHEETLESLLVDSRDGQTLTDQGWIFTGGSYGEYRAGRGTARRFKADVEGDVVAIYLAGTEVCIFERNSLDGLFEAWYYPHPERVPAPRTPVTLRIKLLDEVVPERERFDAPVPQWVLDGAAEEEAEREARERLQGGDGDGPPDAPADGTTVPEDGGGGR